LISHLKELFITVTNHSMSLLIIFPSALAFALASLSEPLPFLLEPFLLDPWPLLGFGVCCGVGLGLGLGCGVGLGVGHFGYDQYLSTHLSYW
jgi:hypothetical protein